MDKKVIAIIVVIIVVAVVAALFLNFNVSKEDTKIKMVSKSSIKENSSIKIKLTNLNGTPIGNQTVHLKIINIKGKINEYSVKTNENGDAKLKLNKIKPGTYTVNFTYDGNDTYNMCNLSKKVKIKEKVVVEKSTNNEEQSNYEESSSGSSSASESDDYWETSIDAPFEYHTEYDSSGGFRQYDRAGNLVGSSYDEDQDDIADYVPKRI